MRAEISYFEWPDLESSGFNTSGISSTLLVFAARPVGGTGGETFEVTVCTLDGLDELITRDAVVVGRHHLFVAAIDTDAIEVFIRDRLTRLDGETWQQLAEKIGRIGYWEFEDYTEYRQR